MRDLDNLRDCLELLSQNKETIKLLNKYKLLKELVKAEYTRSIVDKVTLSKELEEETINKFLRRYGVSDKESLENWKNKNDLTESKLRDLALFDERVKSYCKDNFEHQAESRFLKRKNNLDMYVYSLIRLRDFYKAKELYMRLICKEEEFGDVAATHTEGREKQTRGVVGPGPLHAAHPDLAEVIRIAKVGEIQPLLTILDRKKRPLHIIVRVEYYEPAKLDQSMKENMSYEIFEEQIDSKVDNLTEELLKQVKGNSINGDYK